MYKVVHTYGACYIYTVYIMYVRMLLKTILKSVVQLILTVIQYKSYLERKYWRYKQTSHMIVILYDDVRML